MGNKVTYILSITVLLAVIFSNFGRESTSDPDVKVGVSDDMSGFVLDYMIKTNPVSQDYEAYFIKDCCAKTSQWALTSDFLDMSIMCVSAAKMFVENNSSFIIFSPVTMNTDVFVINGDTPTLVGMTQNRAYQKELIKGKFGEGAEVIPMVNQALPYALEKNEVQAAVIDITKAMQLGSDIIPANINGDYVSYVLVVNKEFSKTDVFEEFVGAFNNATATLQEDQSVYTRHLSEYIGDVNIEEGVYKNWKVKLLFIEES